MVDLILLERVKKLGQMGQIVKVKPGYARNYLLPQKKAMRATKENMAYFETQRAQLEANNLRRRTDATVNRRKDGRAGGRCWSARPAKAASFTARSRSRDIADAITASGYTVEQNIRSCSTGRSKPWACIRSGSRCIRRSESR